MLPSGIFLKMQLDDLVSSLPGRLIAQGPPRLTVDLGPDESDPEERSLLKLSRWSDDWCLIEIAGSEDLSSLVVESYVRYEPVGEVLSCHYRPEPGEYSYALYREGQLLESFESSGPSLETVKFTSELRRVSLQNLLKASDFMIESMNQFGIDSSSGAMVDVRKVVFQVNLPDKKTFWQVLLGAVSSR
jgi:hypothetical protein